MLMIRTEDSLVDIWKLKFGHKAEFLFRLCAQVLVKMVDVFKLILGRCSEDEI